MPCVSVPVRCALLHSLQQPLALLRQKAADLRPSRIPFLLHQAANSLAPHPIQFRNGDHASAVQRNGRLADLKRRISKLLQLLPDALRISRAIDSSLRRDRGLHGHFDHAIRQPQNGALPFRRRKRHVHRDLSLHFPIQLLLILRIEGPARRFRQRSVRDPVDLISRTRTTLDVSNEDGTAAALIQAFQICNDITADLIGFRSCSAVSAGAPDLDAVALPETIGQRGLDQTGAFLHSAPHR